MKSQIMPCPFCGSIPQLERFDVTCPTCNATINSQTPEVDWNRRTPCLASAILREMRAEADQCSLSVNNLRNSDQTRAVFSILQMVLTRIAQGADSE